MSVQRQTGGFKQVFRQWSLQYCANLFVGSSSCQHTLVRFNHVSSPRNFIFPGSSCRCSGNMKVSFDQKGRSKRSGWAQLRFCMPSHILLKTMKIPDIRILFCRLTQRLQLFATSLMFTKRQMWCLGYFMPCTYYKLTVIKIKCKPQPVISKFAITMSCCPTNMQLV